MCVCVYCIIDVVSLPEEEIRSGRCVKVQSASFYTSVYGYRLRASLYPTGSGSGDGTHLSVYIRVVRGDFDPLLAWPFRLPVSVTLYDQDPSTRRHVVDSFVPTAACRQFQRPTRHARAPVCFHHGRPHVGANGVS